MNNRGRRGCAGGWQSTAKFRNPLGEPLTTYSFLKRWSGAIGDDARYSGSGANALFNSLQERRVETKAIRSLSATALKHRLTKSLKTSTASRQPTIAKWAT
jgi:hypothetical protein